MHSQLKWLVLLAIFAGIALPSAHAAESASRPTLPEIWSAHGEICFSARSPEFDARQLVRESLDDARFTPCLTPLLEPESLSLVSAAPVWDDELTAAPQTLLTLHVRLQP